MEFYHPDEGTVPVLLPPRSVLIMTGESRYIWSHAIPPRKSDVLPVSVLKTLGDGGKIRETVERVDDLASSVTSMVLDDAASETANARGAHAGDKKSCNEIEDRPTLAKRAVRTSFTFRKILKDPNNYGRYYYCYSSSLTRTLVPQPVDVLFCCCCRCRFVSETYTTQFFFFLAPFQHFTSVSMKSW